MAVSSAVRVAPEAAAAQPRAASAEPGIEPPRNGETIEQCVLRTLEQYFRDLDGARPHQLHEMVLRAVERPLLRFALERSAGNQSAAAELLGINRNTLRKKLIEHGLVDPPPRPAPRTARRQPARGRNARRAS